MAFSPDGIVLVDDTGRILLANREFARMGSLPSVDEATGQSIYDWLLKDDDLKPLHADPRFRRIIAQVQKQ